MTPEKQRLTIAEACGEITCAHTREKDNSFYFDNHGNKRTSTVICEDCGRIRGSLIDDTPLTYISDFLKDLNAMHKAEKYFDKMHCQDVYTRHLYRICCGAEEFGSFHWGNICKLRSASAKQRADAFIETLREIGKLKK